MEDRRREMKGGKIEEESRKEGVRGREMKGGSQKKRDERWEDRKRY